MAKKSSRLYRTLGELRRRHVIRVVGAYAVCAWLTLQVAAIIFPALMVPDWVLTVLVVLGLAGLPVVAILTWVYDITPAGVVRTIPADAPSDERFPIPAHWNWRWLDYLVIVALLAILAFVLIDREADEIDPGQSIAVLPFSDLSDDGDHSYFSDGLAEALIDSLASVPGLRVISRTSSFSFRDGLTDVRKVASELGVDSVLEGSVRKSAQRVRISARLVDGRRGHSLWSQSYEGDLEDIFEVQDTIARSIAEVMQLEIHGDQRLIDRSTDDSHAYEQYLRGRAKLRSLGTLENIELAIVHFEQLWNWTRTLPWRMPACARPCGSATILPRIPILLSPASRSVARPSFSETGAPKRMWPWVICIGGLERWSRRVPHSCVRC